MSAEPPKRLHTERNCEMKVRSVLLNHLAIPVCTDQLERSALNACGEQVHLAYVSWLASTLAPIVHSSVTRWVQLNCWLPVGPIRHYGSY